MTTKLAVGPRSAWSRAATDWGPAAAGLVVLYVPTLLDLAHGLWRTAEQGHGPIILAISAWLLARKWRELEAGTTAARSSPWGWPWLAVGAGLYVVGRSQGIQMFELGSLIPNLIGMLLVLRGPRALRIVWFPLLFLVFMVPLPGPVVQALTLPMKTAVSYCVEHLLHALGYPIARSGVVIQVGQYMLLVADACAGLHTLFTLEALGLLYLNVVTSAAALRNVLLAVLIVPISFTANVIRVLALCLITYHLGDAAGQGFLHGFAGIVLFLSALALIIAVDGVLRLLPGVRQVKGALA